MTTITEEEIKNILTNYKICKVCNKPKRKTEFKKRKTCWECYKIQQKERMRIKKIKQNI